MQNEKPIRCRSALLFGGKCCQSISEKTRLAFLLRADTLLNGILPTRRSPDLSAGAEEKVEGTKAWPPLRRAYSAVRSSLPTNLSFDPNSEISLAVHKPLKGGE